MVGVLFSLMAAGVAAQPNPSVIARVHSIVSHVIKIIILLLLLPIT
jgi:hypothetical protein